MLLLLLRLLPIACCMLHVAGDTRQRQQPQQFVSAVAACLRGTEFGQSQCQIWPGHGEYCESAAKSVGNLAIFRGNNFFNNQKVTLALENTKSQV